MNEIKCKRCNRVLRNPKSIELGYGKTCYRIRQLNKPKMPEVNNDDIQFLKMEIQTLKMMFRQLRKNGIKTIDRIERIKIEDNPIRNEQKNQFNKCVNELRDLFDVEKWDYKNVLAPIFPREIIESPPIIHLQIS